MNSILITGLTKTFTGKPVPVLRDITLKIPEGSIFAIIGESGAGKTTLARVLSGLGRFDHGRIRLAGHELRPGKLPRKAFHRDVQYLFQHAALSFNPGFSSFQVVKEPMNVQHILRRSKRKARVMELLRDLGLELFAKSRSRDLSGGQIQRLALARALAMKAEVLIADEVTAGLDTQLKLDVMDMLARSVDEGLTLVFITHELRLAKAFAKNCAVLYKGAIVETGPVAHVLNSPAHPYTKLLLSATLDIDEPNRPVLDYDPGLVAESGCPFAPNCPYSQPDCEEFPEMAELPGNVKIRCRHPLL